MNYADFFNRITCFWVITLVKSVVSTWNWRHSTQIIKLQILRTLRFLCDLFRRNESEKTDELGCFFKIITRFSLITPVISVLSTWKWCHSTRIIELRNLRTRRFLCDLFRRNNSGKYEELGWFFKQNYTFFVNNYRNIGRINLRTVSFDADHRAAHLAYPTIFVRPF